MSFAHTIAKVGLSALGLWLLTAAPASAQTTSSYVDETVAAMSPAGTGNVDERTCTFRGIHLAGKVKVVDSFADIRVKAVSSFPDLKVKRVQSFADECGEWQFVDSFPDFKIQFVESFPDVEVAWVNAFPGVP